LSNKDLNKQFRAAVREIERILSPKELTRDQEEMLHRAISKEGLDFHGIVQWGLDMFR